jgi:hypothetical protein
LVKQTDSQVHLVVFPKRQQDGLESLTGNSHVCVKDERVDNENLDECAGPEIGDTGEGGGGGKGVEQCSIPFVTKLTKLWEV